MRTLGCDFDSKDVRRLARAALLKLDAGVDDHFVSKLKCPPYNIIACYCSEPPAEVERRLDSIFNVPFGCLPLICRRWRQRFSRQDFLENALDELLGLFEACDLSIDKSERSHNWMRTDLKSEGRARGAGSSSDRIFNRQCAVAHRNDYKGTGYNGAALNLDRVLPMYGSNSTGVTSSIADPIGGETFAPIMDKKGTSSRRLGSEFIRFRNHKLRFSNNATQKTDL